MIQKNTNYSAILENTVSHYSFDLPLISSYKNINKLRNLYTVYQTIHSIYK